MYIPFLKIFIYLLFLKPQLLLIAEGREFLSIGILLTMVLLFAGCASSRSSSVRTPQKYYSNRVAILPFETSNPYLSGTALSDYFTIEIIQSFNGFNVIERKDLVKILQEQKLTLSGIIRPEKFMKIGSILGVDAIIVGSIQTLEAVHSVGGTISVTIKLLEVSTGRIIWADNQKIAHATWRVQEVAEVAEMILHKAAKKMVERMQKCAPVQDFIAQEPTEDPPILKEANAGTSHIYR